MSLTCFFGLEIAPNSTPATPIIPPKSSLVITQACVTAPFVTGGAVTLYVQGHNLPSKLAICSLHPDKGVFHCPLQLIFSTKVTFFLLPTNPELAVGEPSALLTPVRRAESERKRSRIDKGEPRGGFEGEKGFVDAKTEVSTILPTVHLMGYYEAFDESFSNSDEGDDEDNEDHSDEDEFVSVKKKAASKKSAIEGGNSRGNESSPKGVVGARRGR